MRAGRIPLVALLALAGCGAPGRAWSPTWQAPWATFDGDERRALERARAAWEDGDPAGAWHELDDACRSDPTNLELAVLRQEAEVQWLDDPSAPGEAGPGMGALRSGEDPLDALRSRYLERAREQGGVADRVLAARLESDALAALNLLDAALADAPDCALAHLGRAHSLLRLAGARDRWSEAREALERSLALDPGSPRARRLEAWMLAQAGSPSEAVTALEAWLDATRGDPRVSTAQRAAARLDLARAEVLRGRPGRALRQLQEREVQGHDEARRLTLLACVREAQGRPEEALAAARAAEAEAGPDLLPLVQQAHLLQYDLGRPEEARPEWERVVARAEERGDLAALLESIRARVVLERAEARESAP